MFYYYYLSHKMKYLSLLQFEIDAPGTALL